VAWSDHMAEAAFMSVQGGYIFAAPSARPFGARRFYQVNESEKAELIALRRTGDARWQPLLRIFPGAVVALMAASAASFAFLGALAGLAFAAGAVGLPIAAIAALRVSKARAIAPVLARLTPSTVAIPPREVLERTSEAIRKGWASEGPAAGTPIGSWFEGWNATGISGFAQTIVTTQMRMDVQIESAMARGMYWVGLLAGLGIAGFWPWVIVHNGYARDDILLAPAVLAVALIVYLLGWAWRWLWTGRIDHLFGAARHTPPGRLDELRKNTASLLALR
jgi:hypothetical protein